MKEFVNISTISKRDILNRRVRGQSLYKIYLYIKENEPVSYQKIDETFSLTKKSTENELIKDTLLFISTVGLITGNEELKKECIALSGKSSLNDAEAAGVILKELWKRLRETHKLRVIR